MSWKINRIIWPLLIIIGAIIGFLVSNISKEAVSEVLGISTEKPDEEPYLIKSLVNEQPSPDNSQILRDYKLEFVPELFSDYYGDYFYNHQIMAVYEPKYRTEKHVFIGGFKNGSPKWLGNEHIFFTGYCGSGCQGLYLVNVRNKETLQGTLSYITHEPRPVYTHFQDWYGNQHEFPGTPKELRSEVYNDKVYLVFDMEDDDSKSIGEHKLVFTGSSLLKE